MINNHFKVLKTRTVLKIYEDLKNLNNNYSIMLINSHQAFKNNQSLQWEAKVKGQDINYVLKNLEIQ